MVASDLFPPASLEARSRYRAFMEEHVYPNEAAIEREDAAADALVAALQEKIGRAHV